VDVVEVFPTVFAREIGNVTVFGVEWTLAHTERLSNCHKRETFKVKVRRYNGYNVCIKRSVDNFEVLDVGTFYECGKK
jgi:hypothetical protein